MKTASIDKNALLSSHYLFSGLDGTKRARIAAMGVSRKLDDGEVLFLKGDGGDALFGVLSGKIRISTSAPNGKELILSIVEPGGVFGEIALLDGKSRSADAAAMGECTLFVLQRREFQRFLEQETQLAIHFLVMVCERLRTTNALIEDAAFLNLPARLAKRLVSFARVSVESSAAQSMTEVRISQAELGEMMGTSRESINRLLQEWREEGWVDLGRNRLMIHNLQALQEIVDAAGEEE